MQYEIAINFGRSSILSGLACSLWTPVASKAEDITWFTALQQSASRNSCANLSRKRFGRFV